MTANLASEVHFNASQACLIAHCIRCNISMIQAIYEALQVWESVSKEVIRNASSWSQPSPSLIDCGVPEGRTELK